LCDSDSIAGVVAPPHSAASRRARAADSRLLGRWPTRSCAKRPFGRRGEAIDPRRNGRLQRGGQGQIADVAAADIRTAVAVKRATFCQLAHHLLREERITGGTLGDLVSDGADRRVLSE
jgi:hypothetical protein